MKSFFKKTIFGIVILCGIAQATLYENAEDGLTTGWSIIDNSPSGATINNQDDIALNSKVIVLQGNGYDNAYMLGNEVNQSGSWSNTQDFYFQFKLKNTEGFILDLIVQTQNGVRYLRYSDNDSNLGIEDGIFINNGLGYNAADGEWHTFLRDLNADLKEFEPTNQLLSVDGLIVRGSCRIDDIELLPTLPVEEPFVLYEDAEDGTTNRWTISSNQGGDASVTNIAYPNNHVIKFNSADLYINQYKLNFNNNRHNFNIRWDMKTVEGFMVDVVVMTEQGERVLHYTDADTNSSFIDGDYLSFGLGYSPTNGSWHTINRQLDKDLKSLEPTNKLISVETFYVSANGEFDNIELYSSPYHIYEDAESGTTDNWSIYSGDNTATISNQYDATRQSRVIQLSGNGYAHQYLIGGDYVNEANAWHDTKHSNIEWSIKNSGGFILSLIVNTSNGVRYLNYADIDANYSAFDNVDTMTFGLGEEASNGTWHTYIRNLAEDINKTEPNNQLLSIEGLVVIGSISIDDLEFFNILHPTQNRAGVAITFDDTTIDSWFAQRAMFNQYGAKVTFFVSHFFSLDTAQINKLKLLESDGSEIGCHTYSHKGVYTDFNGDVSRVNEYLQDQIVPARDLMVSAGFNPVSFAYPYGEHQVAYDAAVRNYFPYIRLTYDDFQAPLVEQSAIYHSSNDNYILLWGAGIDKDFANSTNEIIQAMIKARKEGKIITFYGHDVVNDPNKPYNILPQDLEAIVENARNLGLKFYTYKEAYQVGNQ
jgi:peptidoglycan/xylan/chitin deacetylase (PgdA/CDA1 family)